MLNEVPVDEPTMSNPKSQDQETRQNGADDTLSEDLKAEIKELAIQFVNTSSVQPPFEVSNQKQKLIPPS